MRFGEELWCSQAHAALMRLQESELHLMEAMKKWMCQRARSEREFSAQLHQMASALEKQSRPPPAAGLEYISQLNKVRFESCSHHPLIDWFLAGGGGRGGGLQTGAPRCLAWRAFGKRMCKIFQ